MEGACSISWEPFKNAWLCGKLPQVPLTCVGRGCNFYFDGSFHLDGSKRGAEPMTWLVILIILAAAFAPVAYMMPSKRDRALSELRMIARREGLEVEVTQLPKLDAPAHERVSASGKPRDARIDCVSYGLRLPKRQLVPVRYRVLRDSDTEFPLLERSPQSKWELDRRFEPATQPVPEPDYWAVLEEVEALLPEDVLGLAVTEDFAQCYWLERLKPSASATADERRDPAALVADIGNLLKKIAQFHTDYFAPQATDPAPETPD